MVRSNQNPHSPPKTSGNCGTQNGAKEVGVQNQPIKFTPPQKSVRILE